MCWVCSSCRCLSGNCNRSVSIDHPSSTIWDCDRSPNPIQATLQDISFSVARTARGSQSSTCFLLIHCLHDNLSSRSVDDFAGYVFFKQLFWVVSSRMLPDGSWSSSCTCPPYLNTAVCKHCLGTLLRNNRIQVPLSMMRIQIPPNQKRGRGRPSIIEVTASRERLRSLGPPADDLHLTLAGWMLQQPLPPARAPPIPSVKFQVDQIKSKKGKVFIKRQRISD